MKLSNVGAVVTGGASGLGAGAALALSARGARVAILDTDTGTGAAFARENGLTFVEADVSSVASVAAAFAEAAEQLPPLRVLVCCAGIARAQPMGSIDAGTGEITIHAMDLFERVVDVNLLGTVRSIAAATGQMLKHDPVDTSGARGVIVCTGSIAAYEGVVGQTAYSASKAAIGGMMIPLARDLGPYGIRAMTIHPGAFETPMARGLPRATWEAMARETPFPTRPGAPGEFGACVAHICENDMLNGDSIRLDGGLRMRGDLL